jgi:hypothetical protein
MFYLNMANNLPFDTTVVATWLLMSNNFLDRFTKNTFPYLFSANKIPRNNFHVVEGRRGYLPAEAGVSEGSTIAMKASFSAYKATKNTAWLTKGVDYTEAYLNYFYVEKTPPANSTTDTVWISHWAVNASDYAIPGKGDQGTQRAFNFGKFGIIVSFVNGVGTIPSGGTTKGENIADLFRVYSVEGDILYQSVNAPLKSGTNFTISYWVSNYRLDGGNFRQDTSGLRTATNESAGKIVLGGTQANYTGSAKIIYTIWIPGNIPAFSLLEPYPCWHNPVRPGAETYLGFAVDAGWWGADGFSECYKYTGNIKYANAYNATANTMVGCAVVANPSFYYKKEPSTNPFIAPGSQAVQINNPNGYTASRVISQGIFNNFLRLDIPGGNVGEYPSFEVQNYIVQTATSSLLKVYIEVASNVTQVIEIVLSLASDPNDISQEYRAYWVVKGDSTVRNITIDYQSFIKWNSNTVWHPLIADAPVYTYGTGVITSVTEQAVIDAKLAIIQEIKITSASSVMGVGLVLANFSDQPPSIRYAATSGSEATGWRVKITDSGGYEWVSSLPSTNGAFSIFSGGWGKYTSISGRSSPANGTIQKCEFECSFKSTLKIYYCGGQPEVIPTSRTAYKALVRTRVRTAQIIWLGDFKPINNTNDKLKYNPGVVPFTINVLSDGLGGFTKDSWGGAPYAGYQSPYHWQLWGYPERANQALQFLSDSQDAYLKQSGIGLRAPFMQVFLWKYWDTADFRTYGSTGDEWSWNGADPNTGWANYCYRPIESVARYLILNPQSNLARKILTFFFKWIQQFLISSSGMPPTDIPPVVSPQANYHEPHAAALIMRAALYANVAGLMPQETLDIIQRCFNYLQTQFVATGEMRGSFSAGQPTFTSNGATYREYFAFWHMEIINSISELLNYRNSLKYPATSLLTKAGVFPSITPSRIEGVTLPPFKANRNKFDDGNSQRILQSFSGVKMGMTLVYENLSADEVAVFINFWRLSQGSRIPFIIPASIFIDPPAFISAIAAQGSTTYWRFSETYNIETEFATSTRGLYNTSIKIVSVIN